jgi:simple sugar transport system substrate-binding protein
MESANSKAKLITFDLNIDAAQAIKDGKIEFSIDQQPYVQGFLAVTSLYLALKNGNDIGGGGPVLTGPSFVDSSNIDKILPFAQKNTR